MTLLTSLGRRQLRTSSTAAFNSNKPDYRRKMEDIRAPVFMSFLQSLHGNKVFLLEELLKRRQYKQSVRYPMHPAAAGSPFESSAKTTTSDSVFKNSFSTTGLLLDDQLQKLQADTVVSKKKSRSRSEDDQPLLDKLEKKIKQRRATKALELFEQIINSDYRLPAKTTSDLFFMLSQQDQISAYKVLQYYNKHYSHIHGGKWLPMYKRICNAVGALDLDKSSRKETYSFVEKLLSEVEDMDTEAKCLLYPSLVIAFAKQRRVFLGRFAHQVYDAMVENGFEMRLGWLIKVLSLSRYNRQDDLPFHDILARAVRMGGTPHSSVVLPAIHNMFPYTDTHKMTVALQALVDIETARAQEKAKGDGGSFQNDLARIDVSTLEMISTSAAKMGDSSLMMLVWDVLAASGNRPTETIFENTVLAFAANSEDGLLQAFVALESMREYGHKPSRALLRSFSYLIRNELSTVDYALDVLLQSINDSADDDSNNNLLSLESLNVVMSGYAERGETKQTLDLLALMDQNNIQPNEDSYSFAIEVLGKDIHRRKMTDDPSHVHRNLEIADKILTRMEGSGIEASSFVIRQYIELLCLAGEVDTATTVVEKIVAGDGDGSTVCNKTLYRVALSNADIGNFGTSRHLSEMMSEPIASLLRKLRSKNSRHEYVQKIERLQSSQPIAK